MKSFLTLWISLLTLISCQGSSFASIELLTNGNFESGSFANWTAESTQQSPFIASLGAGNAQVVNSISGQPAWFLRNLSANYFGGSPPQLATPIANYSAFNGFDGSPGFFSLRQNFAVTNPLADALLSFTFGVQSSYSGQARVFTANILDSFGNLLSNVFSFTQPTGNQIDWKVTSQTLDITSTLNSLGIGNYQVQFRIDIPQNYTGPAQFAIDNISLQIENELPVPVASVPEPLSAIVWGCLITGVLVFRRSQSHCD